MNNHQSLPPLPEPNILYTTTNRDGDAMRIIGYPADQMREYGDARAAHARRTALEEAAKICERQTETYEETTYADIGAAAIRELLK